MHFKSIIATIFLLTAYHFSSAQTTISYHESSLPFIGVNRQIGERFIPELRVGTNNFVEFISLELALNYKLVEKEQYQFYSGIGGRVNNFAGLVIPVGINIYPFENKNFGFHTELAGIVSDGLLMRGSWGIRLKLN